MARVLVTGSCGYAGACITSALLGAGHEVAGLDTRLGEVIPASLEFDFVVHTAGARPHRKPEELEVSNHQGTRSLLLGLARPTSIILLSSRGVYSPTPREYLSEDDPAEPADLYGRSKRLAELAVIAGRHPWIALRLPAIFGWGEGQPGFSFLSTATKALLRGETVTVHTPDRQHDYLHVQTLARMVAKLLVVEQGWNQIYNLAGPPESHHAIMECLAGAVGRRTDRSAALNYTPGPASRAALLNYAKFTATFGATGQPDYREIIAELTRNCPE